MGTERFVAVINCSDGFVQEPVSTWMRKQYNADYVDNISLFGPDKRLSAEEVSPEWIMVKTCLQESAKSHRSRVVAVVGHAPCSANPATKAEHLAQIRRCVQQVVSLGTHESVIGLWLDEQGALDVVVGHTNNSTER
ncbi:MAG TPA: carbonic anhydrase [Ktedonobacterales bacterium]|nr:carbonic anhydrase [Ktedonobacterales bacterium]